MDGSETSLRSSSESLTDMRLRSDKCTGSLILQVKAQAMIVDESTELWVPIKGSPVAIVSLYQDHSLYSIIGQRLLDKQEIFNCKLTPSTRYQKADATFHHWATDGQRQGLTFLHLTEARKFERLVRKAIKEISPGRDSQSEEEIFVNSDSLLLDCDTSTQNKMPLRPHKPKRLTEEYRLSESSRDSNSKHKNSSSSEEGLKSRRSSPSAHCSVGASQGRPVDHRSAHHLSSGDTTLSMRDPRIHTCCSSRVPTCNTQPTIHSASHISTMEMTSNDPKGSVFMHPGEEVHAESQFLYKGPTTVSLKPTSLPTSPSCRDQYSDYRNDYYIKQEKKSEEKDKSVAACGSEAREILTQSVEVAGEADTCKLKVLKNTPPLPRKKKRHRQSIGLCCFMGKEIEADEKA